MRIPLPGFMALALTGFAAAQPSPPPPAEARVDAIVAGHMQARKIPGLSLAILKDGQLVLAKGFGQASLEWNAPATAETSYLLASITKQFTALAVMSLREEGKLSLDDTLAKYLPEHRQWARITIAQLLTHTAGLADRFETGADGRMYLQYAAADMLDAAARTKTTGEPGAAWQYSDQGYFLLGLVIEKASGQRYADFLQQRIFAPAGMTATSLHDWSAIVPQRADGYALAGGRLHGSRRRYQFALGPHYGVQSTARDLARLDAVLSAGGIVPAAAQAQMWTPGRLAGGDGAGVAGIGYGSGWFLERFRGHREVYHGGSTGTCWYRLPDDRVSVIVLTNLEQASGSDPCGVARRIATEYVPGIGLTTVPPMRDAQPGRTARLRAVLEAFIAGTLDRGDYAPPALAMLQAAARQQSAALQGLGAVTSFELIADDDVIGPVLWFRAVHAKATVHYRFALDPSGRIASLQAR